MYELWDIPFISIRQGYHKQISFIKRTPLAIPWILHKISKEIILTCAPSLSNRFRSLLYNNTILCHHFDVTPHNNHSIKYIIIARILIFLYWISFQTKSIGEKKTNIFLYKKLDWLLKTVTTVLIEPPGIVIKSIWSENFSSIRKCRRQPAQPVHQQNFVNISGAIQLWIHHVYPPV